MFACMCVRQCACVCVCAAVMRACVRVCACVYAHVRGGFIIIIISCCSFVVVAVVSFLVFKPTIVVAVLEPTLQEAHILRRMINA